MKIKSFSILVLFCCVQNLSVAQSENVEDYFRCENFASQYQIEVVNTRNKLNLPTSICDLIAENQDDHKIITVAYSAEVRIKIYPKNYSLILPNKEVVYVSE
jgi:hypothetical protein